MNETSLSKPSPWIGGLFQFVWAKNACHRPIGIHDRFHWIKDLHQAIHAMGCREVQHHATLKNSRLALEETQSIISRSLKTQIESIIPLICGIE